MRRTNVAVEEFVRINAQSAELEGDLILPEGARAIVLFAHGSGSSRHSPRNRFVAEVIREAGLGTLLFDLLTAQEEEIDSYTRHYRFDISLLAQRLAGATDWLDDDYGLADLALGYFGSSTGSAAALIAAARRAERAGAVVSRGGRPDLAAGALMDVRAPTLLIVGGRDEMVIDLNREAMARLTCEKKLETVPGATHLFEEPGALEKVAVLARDWFHDNLVGAVGAS